MTIPASHCEAVLRGMSKQANASGDWIEVKFQIHPQEVPQALWDAALRSRWQLAFVEIGDDEQPKSSTSPCKPLAQQEKTAKHRPPATTRAEKARRLCGVPEFQEFMRLKVGGLAWAEKQDRYGFTSERVKVACQVQSKSQIDTHETEPGCPSPAFLWDALLSEYEQQAGRMAERH